MTDITFKTRAYRFYSPYLYKFVSLYAKCRFFIKSNEYREFFTSYYWEYFLAQKFQGLASRMGGLRLKSRDYKRHTDELVIFGSGSSLHQISDETWQRLETVDTLGLNNFYFHQFKPRIFFMEHGFSQLLLDHMVSHHLQGQPYNDRLFLLHARHLASKGRELGIVQHRPFFYSPVRVKSVNLELLSYFLKKVYQQGTIADPLIHFCSNLDCAIHFGVRAGYKKIYLAGVDLNNSHYFWDEEVDLKNAYQNARDVVAQSRLYQSFNDGKGHIDIHATADKNYTENRGYLDIVAYLALVDQVILTPAGIELYICNSASLLASVLKTSSVEDVTITAAR